MLTDKQIEREEAFCEDWYMTRKMGKTPTYADAIAWADKTMIDKAYKWLIENMPNYINFEEGFIYEVDMADDLRKAMEE